MGTNIEHQEMAEGVRFELTDPFRSAVFKTAALNHSANLPMAAMIPLAARIDQCLKLLPEVRSLTHVFFCKRS